MSERSPDARADGARWIAIGAATLLMILATEVAGSRWLTHRIEGSEAYGADQFETWIRRVGLLFAACRTLSLIALAAIAGALGRVDRRGLGRAGRAALYATIAIGLVEAIVVALTPADAEWSALHRWLPFLRAVGEMAGLTLAALALGRQVPTPAGRPRWLAALVIGAANLGLLARSMWGEFQTLWWDLAIAAAASLAALVIGLGWFVAARLRDRADPAFDQRPDWRVARDGLERFATASVVRVILALVFVPLALLVGLAGSARALPHLALVVAGFGALLSALALSGVAGFRRLPGPEPVRRLASFALVLGALALTVEVTSGLEAVRLVLGQRDHVAATSQPLPSWVDLAMRLGVLASWLALLVGFGRLARHLGAPEVEERSFSLRFALPILFGLAAAGSYGLAKHPEALRPDGLVITAMITLAAMALWGTLLMARTARDLAAAIDRLGDGSPPPAATVVRLG